VQLQSFSNEEIVNSIFLGKLISSIYGPKISIDKNIWMQNAWMGGSTSISTISVVQVPIATCLQSVLFISSMCQHGLCIYEKYILTSLPFLGELLLYIDAKCFFFFFFSMSALYYTTVSFKTGGKPRTLINLD
jgi:hypothetical protein